VGGRASASTTAGANVVTCYLGWVDHLKGACTRACAT
jgi:hypothetical protein